MKLNYRLKKQSVQKLMKKLDNLGSFMTKKDAQFVGKGIVDRMKKLISKGTSPIDRRGKFAAYHGGYAARIKAGGYGGKKLTPVNLHLTGNFLKGLKSKPVKGKMGYDTAVGFYDPYGEVLEHGHRHGANNQRRRPILPEGNERFVDSIMSFYLDTVSTAIKRVLKRKVK